MRRDRRADSRAADRVLERAMEVALAFIREGNRRTAEVCLLCAGVSAEMLLDGRVTVVGEPADPLAPSC